MFKILQTLLVLFLISGTVLSQEINWLTKDDIRNIGNSKNFLFLIELDHDNYAKRVVEEMNEKSKVVEYINSNYFAVRLQMNEAFTVNHNEYPNAMRLATMFDPDVKSASPILIFVGATASESDVLQGYGEIKAYMDENFYQPLAAERERQANAQREKIAQQKAEWEAEKRKARSSMNNYRVSIQNEADRSFYEMASSRGFTVVGTVLLDFETTEKALIANADYYKAAEYMFIILGLNDAAGSPRVDLWNPDSEFHYAKINGETRYVDDKRTITLYSYNPSSNHKAETYVWGNHRGQYKVYMTMKIKE